MNPLFVYMLTRWWLWPLPYELAFLPITRKSEVHQ